MTRMTASWLAAWALMLAMVPLAQAEPIPNGVQWNFLGTASVSITDPTCCQPTISDGQKVFGTLTVVNPLPANPYVVDVAFNVYSLDGAQLLLSTKGCRCGGGGPDFIVDQDGHPPVPGDAGGPDKFVFGRDYSGGGSQQVIAEIGFQPPWSLWDIPSDGVSLVDSDGTAWSGVNPRTGYILPDTPPDASVFETRSFRLFAPAADYTGRSSDIVITVQIDQFLPEPGVTPLLAAALLVLAARRAVTQRLAVHSWL